MRECPWTSKCVTLNSITGEWGSALKTRGAITLIFCLAFEAEAQGTGWPQPLPSECLSAAFYHSVIFERAYAQQGDLSGLKTMGNTPADCQRLFYWAEIERVPTPAALEVYMQFATDLIAERRKERLFPVSPLGCLQASFLRSEHPSLPPQASCESAGYWATFSAPESTRQAERRTDFLAAVAGELG